MAHDGQDIDGVFGGGAHRVGAGAEEAAAGVMDVLQRILAQNAESQERLLQTVLRAVSKDDTSGLPSGLKASDYPDLRSDKRHVRPWAEGVEGWTTVVGWRVDTVEAHQKLISYLVQRLHKSKAASAWWRGCVAQHGQTGGFGTVQDFLKALVATCGEQNAVFKARNALLGLRHDDSVLEYARKFGSYAAELPPGEGIGWLAHLFLVNLKSGLKSMIMGKFPEGASWQQVRDVAVKHEGLGQSDEGDAMDLGHISSASGYSSSDDEAVVKRTGRGSSPYPRARSAGRRADAELSVAAPRGILKAGGREQLAHDQCSFCKERGHWRRDCEAYRLWLAEKERKKGKQ